jgi:hypothetical protein
MKFVIAAAFLFGSLSAMADEQDKAIYDALNVQELALPTAYPLAAFQKNVGRLSCVHSVNTKTSEESYSCDLKNKSE